MSTPCQITFNVSAAQRDKLDKLAAAAGMARSTYAGVLFNAAFSARCKPSGDRDLDATVSRVLVLDALKTMDTASIAARVGLKEATVVKIRDAWRKELRGGKA